MKAIINHIIDIKLSSDYQYIIGSQLIENLSKHVGIRHDQKILILSDQNVWSLYGAKIDSGFSLHASEVVQLVIPAGEASKNISHLELILETLAKHQFQKTDVILGVGGGMICDIAAMAAGLYMRGISHILLATSTLAAIDAAVGGKTAINLSSGKNLAGLFKQPARVLVDIEAFDSLPDRMFNEGLVEALKLTYVFNRNMLALFKKDLREDKKALVELIYQSVQGKFQVVKADEFDQGLRQILNFGHTLGHALEQANNYKLLHGEAVAIGMLYMTKLSEEKGILSKDLPIELKRQFGQLSPSQLLVDIFNSYHLPTDINIKFEELENFILLDKKNKEDFLSLIMLEELGKAKIVQLAQNQLWSYLEL